MKFCTLASGSSGNATYLSDGDTHILIDAGVSCRAICRELSELGVKADELSAIFITHEHGDHIKGLATLSKNAPNCCIYATSSCAAAIEEKNPTLCGRISSVVPGVEININSVSLVAFDTPHDTPYSVGYRVSDGNKTVMIMTDLGYIPPEIHEYLENLDLLLIEANYDEDRLQYGRYPRMIKERIAGKNGHLSNSDCAKCACEAAVAGTRRILLGHLSTENNSPRLAYEAVHRGLLSLGVIPGVDIMLSVAPRTERGELVVLE